MFKQIKASILVTLLFTLSMGLLFPLVITLLGKALFPFQANGSLITKDGVVIGSKLIAQSFTSAKYFQPRASDAGSGYDPTSSGGTNLGPTSQKLIAGAHPLLPNGKPDTANAFSGIADLATAYRAENGLAADAPLPADAATYSASGLDPDISPMNAHLQAARVAKARGVPVSNVERLVNSYTRGRTFGVIGEPVVNVLELNLALDKLYPAK